MSPKRILPVRTHALPTRENKKKKKKKSSQMRADTLQQMRRARILFCRSSVFFLG
jgi:hypothetical protein